FELENGFYLLEDRLVYPKPMTDKSNIFFAFAVAVAGAITIGSIALPLRATMFQDSQQQKPDGMSGMDMKASGQDSDAAKGANMAMSGHDMDMGAHMFMTDLRPANANDEKRAAEIVAELRPAIEKYKDYKV